MILTLYTDVEITDSPNKKQYWIRLVVDGKLVYESQKRDPGSSASWKEKEKSLYVYHNHHVSCYLPSVAVLFYPHLPSRFLLFRKTGIILEAEGSWDDLPDELERSSNFWIRVSFCPRFQG
jgi:hypothetical protein